ncbi:MAG: hypothetical protein SOZ34_08750, partial [Clostridia bacterium]|nr:hypothetical protein [Clostridia bacterium]
MDFSINVLDASSLAEAITYNTSRNVKIKESGSSGIQLTDKDVEDLWKRKHKKYDIIPYASGTNNAKRGKSVLGEDDFKVLIDSSKHLIPITQPTFANLNGGEIVFNKEQMENLRNLWDISQFKNVTAGLSPNLSILPKSQQSIITTDNSVTINGMTVDGGSKNGQ